MPDPQSQLLTVYPAQGFRVMRGAKEGCGLGPADDVRLDDVYALDRPVAPQALMLDGAQSPYMITAGSAVGTIGAKVHVDCLLVFMSAFGTTLEVTILVEVDAAGYIRAIYGCASAPLCSDTTYRLIGLDRDGASGMLQRLQATCFVGGTRITRPDGTCCPVENLCDGDLVLVPGGAAHPVRHITRTTERATGARTPVAISAGLFGNTADLVLSQNTRLYLPGSPENVPAGTLLGQPGVTLLEGGFIDYFQLVFDVPTTLYAEGVAVQISPSPVGADVWQGDILDDELAILDEYAATEQSVAQDTAPRRATGL